jgi:D-amino-acid dehydrogenase
MNKKTQTLVIGGGAIGICCAFYLNQQGKDVAVIEKGEICSGSSHGNAGLIVPSHSIPLAAPGVITQGIKWMFDPASPFYIKPRLDREFLSWLWKFRGACSEANVSRALPVLSRLNTVSLELFDDLAAIEGVDFNYEKKGVAQIFKTRKEFDKGVKEARRLQEYGVESRVLDNKELAPYCRQMRTASVGGLFFPQDAQLIPDRFVHQLARHVENNGVNLLTSTEVIGFETSDRKVSTVKTTRGEIAVEEVILAGGSWSKDVARELDIKLWMEPAKGYSVTFKRPPSCPEIPVMLSETKVVLTPMDDMLEIWRGLRPCSPDGLPYLGRPRRYDNVIIATGHGMKGISLAPVTGKLVAQLAARENPQIDLTALSIERFGSA